MATKPMAVVEATVVAKDGTRIAFERSGAGSPVILVSSALADRSDTKKLAGQLAPRFTVINYDRRGRGASGDHGQYEVAREVEDIAALIEYAGGSASLFGSSSGAVLALRAAAAGLSIDRLALYEPPFVVDEGDFGPPAGFAARIDQLLADGKRSDAVKRFMTEAQGMPRFLVTMMKLMPGVWRNLTGMAHTLPYDIAVMGGTQQGGPLDPNEWAAVSVATLVLTGGKSPAGFHAAAQALSRLLPHAEHRILPGLNHGAVVMAPNKIAPTIADHLDA